MFTIPRREMGVEAVRMLVQRLEHPEDSTSHTIVLPCQIVTGQTVAAVHLPAQKEADPTKNQLSIDPLSPVANPNFNCQEKNPNDA